MRDFIKKYKRDIIVGAVGSIIATIVIWVGNWFISTAPKIGSSILETISNIIYTLAATHTNNYLIIIIIITILSIGLAAVLQYLSDGISVYSKVLRMKKTPKTFSNNTDEKNKQIRSDELNKKTHVLPNTIDEMIRKSKCTVFLTIIVTLLAIILCINVFLFVFKPTTLRDKFDQDITIIYPYVEEQQILQLKSDWALMRSEADYTSIYEYIYTIKKENGLLRFRR